MVFECCSMNSMNAAVKEEMLDGLWALTRPCCVVCRIAGAEAAAAQEAPPLDAALEPLRHQRRLRQRRAPDDAGRRRRRQQLPAAVLLAGAQLHGRKRDAAVADLTPASSCSLVRFEPNESVP